MPPRVRWYFDRLRAMSVPEVAHRTWRFARRPIERARMRNGRYAPASTQLAQWRGPGRFYFDPELAKQPIPEWLQRRAELICAGKREILGLGVVDVPDAPWHYEPRANAWWPRIDAARVLARAPAGFDARLTWELNRGHEWVVLARAWAATGKAQYRESLDHDIQSWRDANPLGIGINWASPMEAAIRIHSLVWASAFLRGESLGRWAAMIHEHAAFVRRNLSQFSSANNHLIIELSGILVAARALGQPTEPALATLEREVTRQIHEDGVNAEMATHYHAFVLEALLLVAYLERCYGVTSSVIDAAIMRMADYLAELRCDDGSLLQQGDSDDGVIVPMFEPDYAAHLVEAAAALRTPKAPVSKHEGVLWITNGAGAEPTTTPKRSRRFQASGQVILHCAELHVAFDAGPFGFGALAAHAHADALAITVAIHGRRVLVDRGTYRYNGCREQRDLFRSTAAHNTVQIGDREQARMVGPFLWRDTPRVVIERCRLDSDGDVVEAFHDGFAPATHRRRLVRHRGALLVIDSVDTADTCTARYHFPPELRVHISDMQGTIRDHATGEDVASLWIMHGKPTMARTLHSDRYAHAVDADTMSCSFRGVTAVLFAAPTPEPAAVLNDVLRFARSRNALPPELAEPDGLPAAADANK